MEKQKIVLAEDDKILSKVIREELEEAGFDVTYASDGEKAVEAVQKESPDLLLLDLLMPNKNGFEALKELKSDPATKDVPVIILTMLSADDDIKKGLDLGANDYIVKSQHAVGEILEKVKGFFGEEAHPAGKEMKKDVELPTNEELKEKAKEVEE